MKYFCCDPRRIEVIGQAGSANAIVYLEVRDHLESDPLLRQRTLFLRLLRAAPSAPPLTAQNVLIDGGERIATVGVDWVAAADNLPPGADPALADGITDPGSMLVVRTIRAGDFSRYTLHLRAGPGSSGPFPGFDPKLSRIAFSFKVECPSDHDCAAVAPCPPQAWPRPEIDYLAKDYTGLRRLMLDRMSMLVPGWTERSAADAGVALVELVAYAADNLSYRQDAIANEAYLATARMRVSVRRHARLVDYALHEGCNARAWVQVQVAHDTTLPAGAMLLTRSPGLPTRIAPDSKDLRDALAARAAVFETAHAASLFTDLNTLAFYTWGDLGCCLARGATCATLRDAHPALRAGDVLVFQEVFSPTEFTPDDADRERRWAVRLTEVRASVDPSGRLFDHPPPDEPPLDTALAVTEIAWSQADALPFPLCISVRERPDLRISVALGNVILADHGQTVGGEALGSVPRPCLQLVPDPRTDGCVRPEEEHIPVRFRPTLRQAPLTHGFDLAQELLAPLAMDADLRPSPVQDDWWAASALTIRSAHQAIPQIALVGSPPSPADAASSAWTVRRDLLNSAAMARDFMVESDNAGTAALRFGDDVHGERPNEDTRFHATYRVGNGTAGNVGAQAIFHIVSGAHDVFTSVVNPMAAAGGIDREDIEAARRDAPEAFRTQERAVTAADYAAAAERRAEIQRAAATFRWTGSWHTVFVSADRRGGAAVDAHFEARLRRHLERFRMAGYDLEVDGARHVALDIHLHLCVLPGYFRSDVLRAVQTRLSSSVLADGTLGVFHPDQFSFGQAVYLSRIVAAAQAVDGVEAVEVRRFERLGRPDRFPMRSGVLPMGRLEIAELANDPNFRERGRLVLQAGGGK